MAVRESGSAVAAAAGDCVHLNQVYSPALHGVAADDSFLTSSTTPRNVLGR